MRKIVVPSRYPLEHELGESDGVCSTASWRQASCGGPSGSEVARTSVNDQLIRSSGEMVGPNQHNILHSVAVREPTISYAVFD